LAGEAGDQTFLFTFPVGEVKVIVDVALAEDRVLQHCAQPTSFIAANSLVNV
jgi:hypothetical protein